MNPYDYTDKQLAPVRESLIRLFGKLKTAKSESLLDLIKRIYKELKSKVDKMYLKIVRYYYKKNGGTDLDQFDDEWLYEFLVEFDPVTGYQFSNEWERKLYRQYEAIEARKKAKQSASEPIRRSRVLLNNQITQKAIEATDTGVLTAYKDQGIKWVRWNVMDDKACDDCLERDGKVFDINKVSKLHPNCRCWFTPVREDPKTQKVRED